MGFDIVHRLRMNLNMAGCRSNLPAAETEIFCKGLHISGTRSLKDLLFGTCLEGTSLERVLERPGNPWPRPWQALRGCQFLGG